MNGNFLGRVPPLELAFDHGTYREFSVAKDAIVEQNSHA